MAKDPFAESSKADPFADAAGLFDDPFDGKSESEAEASFWRAHLDLGLPYLRGLVQQYDPGIGLYRLDFALPEHRLAIEVDGYEFHSSKDAFIKDRRRDAQLSTSLWVVLHFAGSDIKAASRACVAQANTWAGVWIRERN